MIPLPIPEARRLSVGALAATALVDYAPGLDQPGSWHSGVGPVVMYRGRRWTAIARYGYGVDAIRGGDRGGHNVAVMFQYNFGPEKAASDRAYEDLVESRKGQIPESF